MTESTPTLSPIPFDNSLARELTEQDGFYRAARPAPAGEPRLLAFNRALAVELGIDAEALDGDRAARVFTGQELLDGSLPIAQAYAGHQFGHFVPQLGDGRALLLGEVVDRDGRRRDIQLKGSGPTFFSRGGDGLSPLGPVLREYLVSEAMHAMGVPTTRALAAVRTGQTVYREEPLPGAVFTRVASSHLRVGSFEFFAARRQTGQLRSLLEYAIRRHDPDLVGVEGRELAFLGRVVERQAELVARWMCLGFVHGVMNTDNTSIAGETIDYGPCAFMEQFDAATVFSSIDRHGRYAFGNQPQIALWNVARLAEALLPLLGADEEAAVARATEVVETFGPLYEQQWLTGMRAKLGLRSDQPDDMQLAEDFQRQMHIGEVDFTNAYRALCAHAAGDAEPLRTQFARAEDFDAWTERYAARLERDPLDPTERAASMRTVNPAFIPRNHRVEEALEHAIVRDDLGPFRALFEVVTHPFDDQPGMERYAQPAHADDEPYMTFCGT